MYPDVDTDVNTDISQLATALSYLAGRQACTCCLVSCNQSLHAEKGAAQCLIHIYWISSR